MLQTITDALIEAGFDEVDVTALAMAEDDLGIVNDWPPEQFGTTLGDRIKGMAAHSVVSKIKGESAVSAEPGLSLLPDHPPYLDMKG
ncbi:MAG: hypothetical protein IT345_10510, partial [Trueperaceae bacterium]|nr:hypothetical protein [Trueperaceae bacterium]